MLVLSRKVNETVVCGEIRVRVLAVSGKRIKLGVEAPGHVTVLRGERVAPPVDEPVEWEEMAGLAD